MKPKPAPAHAGKMLPIGTKVAVLRPNLWAGCSGFVVKHENDKHWCWLSAKSEDYFHALATIEELKEIKE